MLGTVTPNSHQRLLGETFKTTILAWARSEELFPVLADPHWPAGDGVQVTLLKSAVSPLLKTKFSLGDTEWPELGLHSYPYPCLICVLEGEADIRIGTMSQIAKAKNNDSRKQGVCVFSLPRRSCLIIPPGVPYSDGTIPHWERPDIENAHSQLFWLQILPTGAIAYTCRTAGSSHAHGSAVFIKDSRLSALIQFMLETVANKQIDSLLRSYLTTLLLSIERNWDAGRIIDDQQTTHSTIASEAGDITQLIPNDSQSVILERALRYIQSHLTDPMSPEEIARQAFVSLAQLKRIFRARLDTSIMKYVAQRRIEEAKMLLQRTGLPIEEICETCGYPHRTHFSRVFKEHVGLSPQAFRTRMKAGNYDEISR